MKSKNLAAINERVKRACESAGRDPSTVKLLAISKGQDASAIAEAYALGIRDFGENYAAELKEKQALLKAQCPEIRWHYVGRIQSNKLRTISTATWVHTLDDVAHGEALSKLVVPGKPINVLLQVNLDKDEKRSGVFPERVNEEYAQIMKLPGLNLCGLMTIAPLINGFAPAFWFKRMHEIKTSLTQHIGQPVAQMSMGMSDDFEDAVRFGATWIRIGTLLFGERKSKSKD